MKVLAALGTFLFLNTVSCGFISTPSLLRTPALDSAIVRSGQLGGNFAYSTSENHGYVPVAHPVVPLSYGIQQPVYTHQPIYTQQLYPQQYLGQSIVTSPLYSGLYHQPVFAHNQVQYQPALTGHFLPQFPSTAQLLPAQGSFAIQGSVPVQGQAPIQGQAPVQDQPSAVQPAAPSQPQSDSPASGVTVDDDTVSVEAV